MRVYVVIGGLYEEQVVEGVFATAEAAMDANPVPVDRLHARGSFRVGRGVGWHQVDELTWHNGLDWSWAKRVEGHQVIG